MATKGFGWRSIIAVICLLLATSGVYGNIKQGIPANAPPGYTVGLYTPASLLIVAAIVLFVWDLRRQA